MIRRVLALGCLLSTFAFEPDAMGGEAKAGADEVDAVHWSAGGASMADPDPDPCVQSGEVVWNLVARFEMKAANATPAQTIAVDKGGPSTGRREGPPMGP